MLYIKIIILSSPDTANCQEIWQGEEAIMVLNVDSEVPPAVMEEIRQKVGIFTATFANI